MLNTRISTDTPIIEMNSLSPSRYESIPTCKLKSDEGFRKQVKGIVGRYRIKHIQGGNLCMK